jgi:hypothetical protein
MPLTLAFCSRGELGQYLVKWTFLEAKQTWKKYENLVA